MTPRELRLLTCLCQSGRVSVRDLRTAIGALNPAQIALNLRRKGWKFQTGYISLHDRDGLLCKPGYYEMDSAERERAKHFLEGAERAVAPAPSASDNLEQKNSKPSKFDDSIGDQK